MPNFAEIANKKVGEIERPPLPPVGHYVWTVVKLPTVEKSNDGKFEFVTYPVRAVEARDDVDPDALRDYGDVKNILNSVRFLFNTEDATEFERAAFQHRNFLEKVLRCADPNEGLTQAMNNALNQQFVANIVWKQDKQDNELFHANLGKMAPLA